MLWWGKEMAAKSREGANGRRTVFGGREEERERERERERGFATNGSCGSVFTTDLRMLNVGEGIGMRGRGRIIPPPKKKNLQENWNINDSYPRKRAGRR